jgi:hypothetical protein
VGEAACSDPLADAEVFCDGKGCRAPFSLNLCLALCSAMPGRLAGRLRLWIGSPSLWEGRQEHASQGGLALDLAAARAECAARWAGGPEYREASTPLDARLGDDLDHLFHHWTAPTPPLLCAPAACAEEVAACRAALGTVASRMPPDAGISLLRHIFGRLAAADHALQKSQQPGSRRLIEGRKCLCITRHNPPPRFLVVHSLLNDGFGTFGSLV